MSADPGSRRGGAPRRLQQRGGRQLPSRERREGRAAPGLRPPQERRPRRAPARPPSGVTAGGHLRIPFRLGPPAAPSFVGLTGIAASSPRVRVPPFSAPRPVACDSAAGRSPRYSARAPREQMVPVEALGRPRSARASAGNRPSSHPSPPADGEEPLRNPPPPAPPLGSRGATVTCLRVTCEAGTGRGEDVVSACSREIRGVT
ncbi:translation initiation factor IF-2-like [Lutra lutra]|uniref:translation initiation factor IF-2-like n=1 Tax=Lutra lutra TaxID=9657 RepID=UPI001FD586DC|nr:translation initiation factor IF-2-like [Lutra lutra]